MGIQEGRHEGGDTGKWGYTRVGIQEGECGDIGGWGYRRVEKQEGGETGRWDTGGWGYMKVNLVI